MLCHAGLPDRDATLRATLRFLSCLRALLRLLTLRQSGSRILTDGGMTTTLQNPTNAEAKIHAVCDALARFHWRHCSMEGPQEVSAAFTSSVTNRTIRKQLPSCNAFIATRQQLY